MNRIRYAACVVAVLTACAEGQRDPLTNCGPLVDEEEWIDFSFDADVTTPSRCPIILPYSGYLQSFAATITADTHWVDAGERADVFFQDGNQNVVGFEYASFFGYPLRAQPQGTYTAGWVSDPITQTGHDFVEVGVLKRVSGISRALLMLDFRYNVIIEVSGATIVPTNSTLSLSASIANGQPPLTYQWRRDGQVVGTGATYSTATGSGWSGSRAYSLRVTDVNGNWGDDTLFVSVSSGGGTGGGGGGGGGGTCDPGLSVARIPGTGVAAEPRLSLHENNGAPVTGTRDSSGLRSSDPTFATQLPPCDP